jgi:hypothetical protein
MTAVAEIQDIDRSDVRTIVGNGLKLGIFTTIGVVIFALLSRVMDGMIETFVQSILILAGGAVFAFAPGLIVKARSMDGMAWAMLVGLLGALFFTVFDTIILRPINLYHWTWDAIGGGSGFWYVPVWWMGAAFLCGVGSVLVKNNSSGDTNAEFVKLLPRTGILAVVVFGIIVATNLLPATSAVVALSFSIGLLIDSIISAIQNPE